MNNKNYVKDKETVPVFVYGTLMRNRCNHHYLDSAEFLGNAVIKDFEMYELYGYPGIKVKAGSYVKGELYNVDSNDISRLDMLEGEGFLYNRIITAATADDNDECYLDVNVYVYGQSVEGRKRVPLEEQPWKESL